VIDRIKLSATSNDKDWVLHKISLDSDQRKALKMKTRNARDNPMDYVFVALIVGNLSRMSTRRRREEDHLWRKVADILMNHGHEYGLRTGTEAL
jgi:hypothetical protein